MPRRACVRGRGDQLGGLALRPVGAVVGLFGSVFTTVTMGLAAIAYTGADGESYSPLNHFVSELGQVGVSQLAAVHNVGQIVGGVCFAVFMVGLGVARRTGLAWLYVPVGIGAGVGVIFVGIFPMNQIRQHSIAALTFFALGWIAVGLASLDFLRKRDRRFPWWLALIGASTVLAFIAFLLVATPLFRSSGLIAPPTRPEPFWIVPTLEWAVVIAILAWTFATSWTWWRAERGARA